jgi:hypothetical protein
MGSDELMQASPVCSHRELPKQPSYSDLDKELLGDQDGEFDRSVSLPREESPLKEE